MKNILNSENNKEENKIMKSDDSENILSNNTQNIISSNNPFDKFGKS